MTVLGSVEFYLHDYETGEELCSGRGPIPRLGETIRVDKDTCSLRVKLTQTECVYVWEDQCFMLPSMETFFEYLRS